MHYSLIIIGIISAILSCICVSSKVIKIVISAIIIGLLELMILFWGHPAFGFWYFFGIWQAIILGGIVGGFVGGIDELLKFRGFIIPASISILFIFIAGFSSCQIGRSDRYKALIGDIEKKEFSQDVAFMKPEKQRLVPKELAYNYAKKVLNQSMDGQVLGSQLEIDFDSAAIQLVNGHKWWIFPLDFIDFWKWNNRETIPGYIRVDAHNPNTDPQFVDKDPVTGKSFKIKYTPKAYFSYYLDRKVYNSYPWAVRTERTFEVDDNWRPYYVYSVIYPSIGFSGYKTSGIILADSQTGSCKFKGKGEIPSWVDRIRPLDQALEHTKYWGLYPKGEGYWNQIFGKRNIQKPTEYDYGPDMWFVEIEGRSYWFSGMTSLKADESLVGFMFIDTKDIDGKAIYYEMAGSDENGVIKTVREALGADGKEWVYKMPIPRNYYGHPTWVVIVLGQEGTFQRVALVDITNNTKRAIGKNLTHVIRIYQKIISQDTNAITVSDESMYKVIQGELLRKFPIGLDGGLTWNLWIDSAKDKLFTSDGTNLKTVLVGLAKPGDKLVIKFIETNEGIVPIEEIKIIGIDIKKSKIQTAYDDNQRKVKKLIKGVTEERNIDSQWDNMTPDQKKKLFQKE